MPGGPLVDHHQPGDTARARRSAPSKTGGGAWRDAHPVAVVVLLLVAIAVGWALPLLGVTLAAFLLFDLILGGARRWRARRAIPTSPAPAPG